MQQVNFSIEIVIHDDASTDGSQEIIKKYMDKNPNIQWNAILQTANQYSQGISVPQIVLPNIRGKYMAICEGDDYWTDPYKLQKQVDFLEANPDVSCCHHSARITWEEREHADEIYPAPLEKNELSRDISMKDFIDQGQWLVSSSVVYRWCFNHSDFKFEEQFPTNLFSGDIMLTLFHAARGRIVQVPSCMSVYRRHGGGITAERENRNEEFYTKNAERLINLYVQAERVTGYDCTRHRQNVLLDCIFACMTTANGRVLEQLKERYPEDYDAVTARYHRHLRHERVSNRWQNVIATTPTMKFIYSKLGRFFRKLFSISSLSKR